MLPAFGGALIGYGIASKRKGLIVAGAVVVLGSFALLGFAIAQQKAAAAK